jgi:hypothetical protein
MKRVAQKSHDDCTICTIAMVTGEPYESVHEAAKLCGYVFKSGTGVPIGQVLMKLGYDVDWIVGFHAIDDSIVSVNSLHDIDGKHAVVCNDGGIIDPSNREPHVTLDHARRTTSYTYFNIIKNHENDK